MLGELFLLLTQILHVLLGEPEAGHLQQPVLDCAIHIKLLFAHCFYNESAIWINPTYSMSFLPTSYIFYHPDVFKLPVRPITFYKIYKPLQYLVISRHMQAQSDEQVLALLKSESPSWPITRQQLQSLIQAFQDRREQLVSQPNIKAITAHNCTCIQQKFITMMQSIFTQIEPHLHLYPQHLSIDYLDPLILAQLDPSIYHRGYRLHKRAETPMSQIRGRDEVDTANRMFGEIFDVMHELMTTMKIYYGYGAEDKISEAMYESIALFMEKHQDCFLVQEDRKSYSEHQQQQEKKEEKKDNEPAPYDILIDVLKAIGEDKGALIKTTDSGSMLNKAQGLLGVIYKYAIAPTISYTYETIRNINPLATNTNLTAEQQINLRMSLMDYLRPNLSVRDPLDEAMVTMLIKLMPMGLGELVTLFSESEKEELLGIVTEALGNFENPHGVFEQIVKQIMKLLELIADAKEDQRSNHFVQLKQAKWIIIFYKAFEQNYSPQRRRVLFKVCHHASVKGRLPNSIGILKMVESDNLAESDVLVHVRKLPLTKKCKDKKQKQKQIEMDKQNQNEKQKQKQRQKQKQKQKQKQQHHKIIDLEFHRIHLLQLKQKYDKLPLIKIQRLTDFSPKRVVTFLFSGFMSEDTCKVEQWGGLLDTLYDSQMYSIRWESKSYGSILDFTVETAKDLLEANLKIGILGSIGGPYLRAIAIIREIYKKYNSNPFNPAYKSAEKTGEYLAEFMMANFKGHFFNLVGFSLGTELIKNILKKLAQKHCLHMINKVYLMGGLTDRLQLQSLIQHSPTPLNIINLYSLNDNVLKYLLKLCRPSCEPVGLGPLAEIPGHNIRNQDCSVIIKGHLEYRTYLNLLAKLLNMKDD